MSLFHKSMVAHTTDTLVLVTNWDARFPPLDLDRVRNATAKPVMVDLRNIYTPDEARKHGFVFTA